MKKEYICLSCGNQFAVPPSAEKKCSRCDSTNVLKLNPESIFGFLGGG
jgi:DNA-directed RNA polymerase subunit RPC12/RpoP